MKKKLAFFAVITLTAFGDVFGSDNSKCLISNAVTANFDCFISRAISEIENFKE